MRYDCILFGSCVADILCRPVPLNEPLGAESLHRTGPIVLTAGGITANAGVTMSRLGMRVAVLTAVGDDPWGPLLTHQLQQEGVDTAMIDSRPDAATSATVVTVDPSGQRSFLHHRGAHKQLNRSAILDRIDVFSQARALLLGYYSLMPNLEGDLPEVLAAVRRRGCMTALDAAGDGGTMEPLSRSLPQLDVYVPSFAEASGQTGLSDPRRILDAYRACGAPGVLGVKLGADGVLLSDRPGGYVELPAIEPPGAVVDTTGAGDSFYAGLLTGLLKGLTLEDAGRLGAACGACCVTAIGGWRGARNYAETAQLAGLA